MTVYTRLREHLDRWSMGYPATPSGVELRILKAVFAEDEAELGLHLDMKLASPETVAARAGRDVHEVTALLERMAAKGQVFRLRWRGQVAYAAVPFVVGVYEYQVERMDEALARLVEEYLQGGMLDAMEAATPILRPIPVGASLEPTHAVAPHEDARAIVARQRRIAVARCLCRVQQGHLDQACGKPVEVCLMFGSHADFYVENGLGRYIEAEEALDILARCEEAGLVAQPSNMVEPKAICNCCGDCCGVLRALRRHPRPAEMVSSSYRAEVDAAACTACEDCLERCQVDAIAVDEVAAVDPHRCIGCGLCVATCPSGALSMVLKPAGERVPVPADGRELLGRMAEDRAQA